jgi:O-antigen/teichoic acid export membrane protein
MNKYLRAISTNYIFFFINILFFFVITAVAIRVMGEIFYGLWVMLNALLLFSNVGNLGIDAIVMKFSSEIPTKDGEQLQANRVMTAGYIIVFVMSVITAVFLLVTRNLIADNINTTSELRDQFRIAVLWIAASIFPQFLARVPQGFLLAKLHNRVARQSEMFSSVSLWLGAIGLVAIEKNLVWVAIWCFINRALTFGLFFVVTQRVAPFKPQSDKSTLFKMLDFSKYTFLESLAISFFQQFDKVIVGFTLGPVLAGAYSVGTSMALRLTMVTGQATEVMIPYASLNESRNDQKKLYNTFRKLSFYSGVLLAGLSSFFIIWMKDFLYLWISLDYAVRYENVFRILIVAYSLLGLSRPAHQTLTGIGKVKFTAMVYLLSTSIMLIGLFFLSRKFGLLGAASSNLMLISLLVFNLFVYTILQKPVRWKDTLSDLQWGLLTPILVYGFSLFLPSLNIFLKLVETVIVEGILLTWVITHDALVKTKLLQVRQFIIKYWIY